MLCLLMVGLGCSAVSAYVPETESDKDSIDVYFNNPYVDRDQETTNLRSLILDDIDAAQNEIDVATYNFSDKKIADRLVKKAKSGVKVYVVIDEDNYDDDVVETMLSGGVKVKKAVSGGLMHAKYMIVDGIITFSGSANMTDSSFFYDNNNMVRIESQEIAETFQAEFYEMFKDSKFGADSPDTPTASVVKLNDGDNTKVQVLFSPDDGVENRIVNLVYKAQKSIYVLAYSFSSDKLAKALEAKASDGLDVKVVFEDTKAETDAGGQYDTLKKDSQLGVYVDGYDDKLMHEKVIVLDDKIVIEGSYNYTNSAERKNDEQVLLIQNPDIANQYLDEFDKILDKAK